MVKNLEVLKEKIDEDEKKMNDASSTSTSDCGHFKCVKKKCDFKSVVNNSEIDQMKKCANKSENKIKWAINMYSQRREERLKLVMVLIKIKQVYLNTLYTFMQDDLAFALSRFI